jgi:hypothetical protein
MPSVTEWEEKINGICRPDPWLKQPLVLLNLGKAFNEAKSNLGDTLYAELLRRLPCLRHEHDRSRVTVDKDQRIAKFATIKACWTYHHRIPALGWGLCRQISCLCPNGDETFLIHLLETGAIRPGMTREQMDALRSLMRPRLIAPRHPRRVK